MNRGEFSKIKMLNTPSVKKTIILICLFGGFLGWLIFYTGFLSSVEKFQGVPSGLENDYVLEIEVIRESGPRILRVEKFVSGDDCDSIRALAEPQFKRSTVAGYDSAKDRDHVDDARTSSGAWLSKKSKEHAIRRFTNRVSKLSQLPQQNGEEIQVLRYEINQQYKPHHDYFDPEYYGQFLTNGGQRVASVMLFLNNVTEGGETSFPKAGIKIKPLKGSAIIWYNVHPNNGSLDPNSMHGGNPVIQGTKYVAVQWMREKPVS